MQDFVEAGTLKSLLDGASTCHDACELPRPYDASLPVALTRPSTCLKTHLKVDSLMDIFYKNWDVRDISMLSNESRILRQEG